MMKVYLQPVTTAVRVYSESAFLSASMEIAKDDTIEINRQKGFDEAEITFDSWD